MIKFNVASINSCTETEGPYKRLAIWFQGCNIHCKGCCNPDYQPLVAKNILSLNELIKIIFEAKEKFRIEGVTYSVISFTGRRFEEVKDTLGNCDIVLDGCFDETQPEKERKLLGSANQRVLVLTDRYVTVIDWFSQPTTTVEVNVGGKVIFNGDYI